MYQGPRCMTVTCTADVARHWCKHESSGRRKCIPWALSLALGRTTLKTGNNLMFKMNIAVECLYLGKGR